MATESWSSVTGGAGRACDSCKVAQAAVFCRADAAFLCLACDGRVHAANKLATRHGRVWLCEVCEQAPAAVSCKADAAVLCASCDRDIHSANPLARRHHRVPVAPFYDAAVAERSSPEEFSEEEAEAVSWLLPDAKPATAADEEEETGSPEYKSEYLFPDMDPYLDLDLDLMISGEQNKQGGEQQKPAYSADGVVPVQEFGSGQYPGAVVDGYPSYHIDYRQPAGSKPFLYNFSSQTINQTVSSSSMDVGVVPDHNMMADVSNAFAKIEPIPTPVSGVDREARVLRYREKRKNRRFEKTIRYTSRKAYAETRPRIKGRFAKRSELEVDSLLNVDVPRF